MTRQIKTTWSCWIQWDTRCKPVPLHHEQPQAWRLVHSGDIWLQAAWRVLVEREIKPLVQALLARSQTWWVHRHGVADGGLQGSSKDLLIFYYSRLESAMHTLKKIWASHLAQMVKNQLAMQETQVQSLGWEDPLEKGMVTHFSIIAWEIPWTEGPGRLQSMGLQKSHTQPND